jgi:hypothetical protein
MKCVATFDRNKYLENQTAQIVDYVTIPTHLLQKLHCGDTVAEFCVFFPCVIASTDYLLLINE